MTNTVELTMQEKLEDLKTLYSFDAKSTKEELDDKIDNVVFKMRQFSPVVIVKRTLFYEEGDKGLVSKVKVVVKPKSTHALTIKKVKKTIELFYNENFYSDLVDNLLEFVTEYNQLKELQPNLYELNQLYAEVQEEYESPISISFGLSNKKIIEIGENFIVVGVTEEALRKVPYQAIIRGEGYDDQRREKTKQDVADTLLIINQPIEFLKTKDRITKELGIYSNRRRDILIKKSVTFDALHHHKGVLTVERGNSFALIKRVPISDAELKDVKEYLDATEHDISKNPKPTKNETEEGKLKLLTVFLVKPFDIETGEPATKETVKEYVEYLDYYMEHGKLPEKFKKIRESNRKPPVGVAKAETK